MFVVRIADNFHYMDESETYAHGKFATWPEAVVTAKSIVDRCLAEYSSPGMTADALFTQYTSFGDDPYIIPVPEGESFSAWDYAEQRCVALCGLSTLTSSSQHDDSFAEEAARDNQNNEIAKNVRDWAHAYLRKLLLWLFASLIGSLFAGWISLWAADRGGWEGQFVRITFGLAGALAFFTLLMFCVLIYSWVKSYKPALRDASDLVNDRELFLLRYRDVFGPIPWG